MLRKFRVKNFLSFRNWQTLDLTVAGQRSRHARPLRAIHPRLQGPLPHLRRDLRRECLGEDEHSACPVTFLTGKFVRYSQIYPPKPAPIPSIPCFGIGRSRATARPSSKSNSTRDLREIPNDVFEISIYQTSLFHQIKTQSTGRRISTTFHLVKNLGGCSRVDRVKSLKFGNDLPHSDRNDPSIAKIKNQQ